MINQSFWKIVASQWSSVINIETKKIIDQQIIKLTEKTGGDVDELFLDANKYIDSLGGVLDDF